ncbi:MAG: single-stranded-DNA-specific exonuclease RecJ [Candidatus Magasanikbacteria bacterium]|nr:single-stranded-DNA-specific exonuclease RecJ [Candidatus Magasanikbacteria bacterium]
MKKWIVQAPPPSDFINSHPELPPIAARLLWNRNIHTQEQIDEFLNPDYLTDVHDPFLFKDMRKAVNIIFEAIKSDKNIMVHGDYDADGVCASTILISTLKNVGAKKVGVFLPHREIDGYGINMNTVKSFIKQKIDLIITCDCGISNFDEIAAAKDAGMQVILTDHHTVPAELPGADAIIHALVPNEPYPDKGLSGAAVAFKLAQALIKTSAENGEPLQDKQSHEGYEKWLLDLVAIATIGDMVPLVGESRTLTRYGLTVLNKTKNIGLRELLIASSLADENGRSKKGSYTSETVSFQIVPRLNAAGRMDHANTALALLMAEKNEEALALALQLNKNNTDRQKLTEQMVEQAINQITESKQESNSVLIVMGEKWSTGIIGLIAGKIKDLYYKPSIVLGSDGNETTASGRSVPQFNMIAALQSMPQYFSKFGGHPLACGFSLKSKDLLKDFSKKINALAKKQTTGIDLVPQIVIDAEVNLEDVDWKLYDILQKFEPFGQTNEEPLYLAKGLTVIEISPVGQVGRHLKLLVKHNSHLVKKTIAFGFGNTEKHPADWKKTLKPGDKIDMVFSVSVNEWNGNRELELSVKDMKKANASD